MTPTTIGTLFLKTRECLGFGSLTMWIDDTVPDVVTLSWIFKVGSEKYGQQTCVSGRELEHFENVETFAELLSEKWKHKARRVKNDHAHGTDDTPRPR